MSTSTGTSFPDSDPDVLDGQWYVFSKDAGADDAPIAGPFDSFIQANEWIEFHPQPVDVRVYLVVGDERL